MPEFLVLSENKLIELSQKADAAFWVDHWSKTAFADFLKGYENGKLDAFRVPFLRYLPKNSPVLEGGCGRGQYVVALQKLGYDVYGVDYAEETIRGIKSANPAINVSTGDVRDLGYEDEFFGAYISLGVIEHYWDRAEEILNESYRVLRKNGLLLISVPHFNSCLRRRVRKDKTSTWQNDVEPSGFYQFYFVPEEIVSLCERCGFSVIGCFYYGGVYGAKRCMPFFLKLYSRIKLFRFVCKKITLPQFIVKRWSHMIMIIAEKRYR